MGPGELEVMTRASRPLVLAGIGGVGLLAILWLMVVKPFWASPATVRSTR